MCIKDITALLSRSQRRQLAGLVFQLYLFGRGELELIVENSRLKRYLLRHDPLLAEIKVNLTDDDYQRHFGADWPWWCSIAAAIHSICQRTPAHGSVWIQVEEGHVRAVREVNHVPALPPSDRLKPPATSAP